MSESSPHRKQALVAALAVSIALASCVDKPVEPLPEPADLGALGPRVRQQYIELRAAAEAASSSDVPAAQRANAIGRLGQWFHAYTLLDHAKVLYLQAATAAPSDPKWSYYLALVSRELGDHTGAMELLETTVDLEPNLVPALVWLGEARWAAGQADHAAQAFERALERDPNCVRALTGLATIASAVDRNEDAIGLLERALGLQPRATAVRYQLGLALRRSGDLERARTELAAIPETNRDHRPPDLDDPWMEEIFELGVGVNHEQARGHRALAEGRFADAARHFRAAADVDASSIESRINLAIAFDRAGLRDAAVDAAREAVEVDTTYARARVVLAQLLLSQGHRDAARDQLETALAHDPEHEIALHNLGQMELRDGDLSAAASHLARARELDPQLTTTRLLHAVALVRLGRLDEARRALETDVSSHPGDPPLSLLLARVLACSDTGDDRALDLVERVAGAPPTVTEAETRAMTLAGAGRFADAVAWQESTVRSVEGRPKLRATFDRAASRLADYRARRPCRTPWEDGEQFVLLPVQPPNPTRLR